MRGLRRVALPLVGLLAALATLAFIYAWLWPFVGRFPAESLSVAEARSNAALALCYDARDTGATFSLVDANSTRRVPAIVLGDAAKRADLTVLAGSRSLLYVPGDRSIHLINPLDQDDLRRLDQLVFWGPLHRSTVDTFVRRSQAFDRPCPVPSSDRGITEAYWATKGTAVLHHWAYLYDASVFDGKPQHAQYGTLVSVVARVVASPFGLGPTTFVRAAWWIFFALGLATGVGWLVTFRHALVVGVFGFACQILAFASLGSFTILLAPGYHWSREFVIFMPLLIAALLASSAGGRRGPVAIAAGAMAVTAYLLDPSFAIFTAACVALAVGIVRRRDLLRFVGTHRRSALLLGAGVAAIVLGVAIVDRSNLTYVIGSIVAESSGAFIDVGRNWLFAFDGFVAFVSLTLAWYRRFSFAPTYLALVSVVVFTYYVITPDAFHYGKYVAYVLPFYAAVGAAIYTQLRRLGWSWPTSLANLCIALATLGVCVASFASLLALSQNWQLRVYELGGRAYFSSRPIEINGRIIDADLNAVATERLRAFPDREHYDYIVSALDKYVLFLYDRHNGFDSVDFLTTMASDAQLRRVEKLTSRPNVRILLDRTIFDVDPFSGILSTQPTLGATNDQSVLSVGERVRYSELANDLLRRCQRRDLASSWSLLTCP